MKSCGCEYCNDLRHISPAKYIGVDNLPKYDDARIFIEDAAKNKKIIRKGYKLNRWIDRIKEEKK